MEHNQRIREMQNTTDDMLKWMLRYGETASKGSLSPEGQKELATLIGDFDEQMRMGAPLPTDWQAGRE
jgi:hypothetical protein